MSALPSLREFAGAQLLRPAPVRRQADAIEREAKDRELSALMRAAQHGDRAAYTRLVREIMPLLQRLLWARLRFLQAADRDDLMQDVLLSLHRAMATYDPQREFVPWLMAIARNKMVDRARRCARSIAYEALVDDVDAIGADEGFAPCAESYGDPEALRQAVSRLPAGQRTAIELLKIRELPSEEAAGVTGMSSVALRVSVHRAIKTLRVSLNNDTVEARRAGPPSGERGRAKTAPGDVRGSCPDRPQAQHREPRRGVQDGFGRYRLERGREVVPCLTGKE